MSAPVVKVKLRKLRRTCWPRRHRWRPCYHYITGVYMLDRCDNCASEKRR